IPGLIIPSSNREIPSGQRDANDSSPLQGQNPGKVSQTCSGPSESSKPNDLISSSSLSELGHPETYPSASRLATFSLPPMTISLGCTRVRTRSSVHLGTRASPCRPSRRWPVGPPWLPHLMAPRIMRWTGGIHFSFRLKIHTEWPKPFRYCWTMKTFPRDSEETELIWPGGSNGRMQY